MSLSFILFVAALGGLIVFLFIRAGKYRGKDSGGGDTSGTGFSFDSDSHCGDSGGGDCGGDGGGGGD
ncbi:hypothetical protein SKTS_21360 [Sulfurimicrobium lacus]|uniref:Uncharacterized protein n=1 Tax=Sulfurimicrobium lacus TaxID=2715678 RepID=A0A6F8VD36_9PROT|nr:hypothetical protein [Sulfurimicrobium lacus]BCB27250.1 hypothetical protein SKTS_21360 [Sulfurimicrobium lacus]